MTLGPRHIAGFGGVFIAAIVALSGYDIYRSYQKTIDDTGRELDAHARVIAEQTARSMQAIDVVLRHLAEESRRGAFATLSDAQLHAYLREQSIGLVQVDGLIIVQASGVVRAASHIFPLPEPRPNVSDFTMFGALREKRDLGLQLGPAFRSDVDGAWVFPLARRIETATGEFAGVASARGKIDYFQQFYRAVQLEPGTAVALMHRNGTLMARYPAAEAALGQQLPAFDEMVRTRTARAVSSVDGVDRFGALELVPDYPLAVIVTRDATSALAAWHAQSRRTAARTLGLAVLAVVLLVLLMRQFSRLYKTSASLESAKERYALAVAGSDDGIWDYDFTTGKVFASARARELSGLPPSPEMLSASEWIDSLPIHPDDRPVWEASRAAHLAGTTPAYEGEWRMRQPDGSYRWVRVHGLCVRDASGKPYRMAGSISDIDARKRAEEALRVSEERYALAVAGSDDGIWDYDFAADKVFTSARARELLGLPAGAEMQPIGGWAEGLPIHPEDKPRWQAAREAHLAGQTSTYEGEWRMRRPDGGYRWVRVRGLCVRDAAGNPKRMAGSVSDIDARKRAEEALRASQERYALAVAGSDDGIWEYDFTTGRAFASARARELSGLPPGPEDEAIDAFMQSLPVHPDDKSVRTAALEAHLAGRTAAYEGEWRIRGADGFYRWVRVHGLCIRDASGKPHRMAGSISDIDDRKRAEEALRASEERFALAVAGSNDGIVDWDIPNDRIYTSKRAMEIFDLDSEMTVRTRDEWRRLVRYHPDDRRIVRQDFQEFLAGSGELRDVEYRILLRNGAVRWVRHRHICVRSPDGTALRLTGSVSDIDAQKRAEEGLRASEEHYRSIFNAAADALVLRDAEAKVVDVNPAFLQISGYTREEVISGTRWIFALPEMAELAKDMHRRCIAGETVRFEMKARRKDGTLIDIEMRAVPIRYRGQQHALGMARDITAQKRAEAERLRLEGQLLQAKKLEAIGTLAGGIAHDFNNILSATLGYGEMAQKAAPAGTALRRHIDAVVSAGMRAKSLVERILAFSRSGMGERVPVHVQSVVAEALDLLAASLPAHVRLDRELAAGNAAVMGDPTQIHQVVMNLCANAAQAMKSPGSLNVALDVVEKSRSRVATSELAGGRYIRLRVRDSGSGIAPGVLERIFDPFFTTKGAGVGTGLGLSLVHGIVTDLGGGIDVESELGKGTTFTVYLPWSDAVAAPAGEEEAIAHGAGEAVLLVDDEESLVRLGEEMIAGLGYEPVGFASSNAALEAFRAEPERFSAVLTDESMPEMTGCELAEQIRRLRPGVPIVLMTGFVHPGLAARAESLGVCDVLAKPLVARDIARALAGALAQEQTVK